MKTKSEKSSQASQNRASANRVPEHLTMKKSWSKSAETEYYGLADNRRISTAQLKMQEMINNGQRMVKQKQQLDRAKTYPNFNAPFQQKEDTAGNGVMQMAGTKPNTPSADGRYIIKLSSERERYT